MRSLLLGVALILAACSPAATAEPTASPPDNVALPSNACGGFHLTVVNGGSGDVTVTVNGDHSFSVDSGATVSVAEWLPPPYGLSLALPWSVVVADSGSGEVLLTTQIEGPADQTVTLTDSTATQAPGSPPGGC